MSAEHLFNAAIKGLIEGVTEFLPISSTGHLILVRHWFPLTSDPLRAKELDDIFDVVIQFPAILAIVVLYRQRLWDSVKGIGAQFRATRFWIGLVVAFMPAAVIGALFHHKIEDLLMYPRPVAFALIIGGIALIIVERFFGEGRIAQAEDVPTTTALAIGFWQCLGMIPGTSRSGATIVGARTLNLTRAGAAEYSFFLALPTMFGAFVFKMYKGYKLIHWQSDGLLLLIGSVMSFVVAALVVFWFVHFLQSNRRGLALFGVYRIIVGALVLYFALK